MYLALYETRGEHSGKLSSFLNSKKINVNKSIQATHTYYDNHWIKWKHIKRTYNSLLESQGRTLIESIS